MRNRNHSERRSSATASSFREGSTFPAVCGFHLDQTLLSVGRKVCLSSETSRNRLHRCEEQCLLGVPPFALRAVQPTSAATSHFRPTNEKKIRGSLWDLISDLQMGCGGADGTHV